MKQKVGEVGERREDVLWNEVDPVVGQGQASEVGQPVEGPFVDVLDAVSGQTEHSQVVDVDEGLAVQRLRPDKQRTPKQNSKPVSYKKPSCR